jgi:hypothetical protein
VLFPLALLAAMTLVLWHLARTPFTPWSLLAWPVGLYVTGWIVYSIWERLATPNPSRTDAGRGR